MLTDNPIGLFASAPTGGATDVKEFYGEMLLPVFEKLDLELGYRYSDFSTAGGHDTYKALFTYEMTDRVSFRGGRQVATRAPNTAELFTAPTQIVVASTRRAIRARSRHVRRGATWRRPAAAARRRTTRTARRSKICAARSSATARRVSTRKPTASPARPARTASTGRIRRSSRSRSSCARVT